MTKEGTLKKGMATGRGKPPTQPPQPANQPQTLSLNNLSERGEPEEALSAFEETVEIYRDLTQARHDASHPDLVLAKLLIKLADRLHERGEPEEALSAFEETVEIYLDLAQARHDAFNPDLTGSPPVMAKPSGTRRTPSRRRERPE